VQVADLPPIPVTARSDPGDLTPALDEHRAPIVGRASACRGSRPIRAARRSSAIRSTSRRSPSPTSDNASCARWPRSERGTPAYINGNDTCFNAEVRGSKLNCWKTKPIR
jgi:hypothetical protein